VLQALYNRRSCQPRGASITDIVKALRRAIEALPQAYIILDAVDECEEQKKPLELLVAVTKWKPGKLYVLVTNRWLKNVDESLASVKARRIAAHNYRLSPDIEPFVRVRLNADKQPRWPADMQAKIAERLTEGAQGRYV
jgi:hypothetical protein